MNTHASSDYYDIGAVAGNRPPYIAKPGEYIFAAAFPEHVHLHGQCQGLLAAGAELKWIYDPDPRKMALFAAKYPQARAARSFDEILADPAVRLVAAAGVPSEHGPIGCRTMEAGKDYFTDKAAFTTLEQLIQARAVVAATGRKYLVYFAERLESPCVFFAGELVRRGAIGRVIQIANLAPHRLNKSTRPAWFFEKAKCGGILCDLGSHQFEQFLFFSGAKDASVVRAVVGNYANQDHPEFEDFGEASSLAEDGTSHYARVDWFTPAGLRTWGDGRTFVLGTKGYIELRKYIDLGHEATGDHLYLVDDRGEHAFDLEGKIPCRFYGDFILDCQHRTEKAISQEHIFKTAERCLKAQASAKKIELGKI
jgi:predicted dehydrogenase